MKLLGQAIQNIQPDLEKYENSSQCQKSTPNVTNFQLLLAFPMGHILTKLHRFPTSSFRDFLRTDAQTHRQTPPKIIPACSMRAGNKRDNTISTQHGLTDILVLARHIC